MKETSIPMARNDDDSLFDLLIVSLLGVFAHELNNVASLLSTAFHANNDTSSSSESAARTTIVVEECLQRLAGVSEKLFALSPGGLRTLEKFECEKFHDRLLEDLRVFMGFQLQESSSNKLSGSIQVNFMIFRQAFAVLLKELAARDSSPVFVAFQIVQFEKHKSIGQQKVIAGSYLCVELSSSDREPQREFASEAIRTSLELVCMLHRGALDCGADNGVALYLPLELLP